MTGCDAVSSFFGKGKKGIWKNVIKDKDNAINLLKELSVDSLRKFIIQFVYNDKISKTLTEMRESRWKRMKRKCFARLGIDEDSHQRRFERVRYIVNQIESYENKYESKNPLTNGYRLDENMNCVPLRFIKPAMPDNIATTSEDGTEGENSKHTETDEESENSDGDEYFDDNDA